MVVAVTNIPRPSFVHPQHMSIITHSSKTTLKTTTPEKIFSQFLAIPSYWHSFSTSFPQLNPLTTTSRITTHNGESHCFSSCSSFQGCSRNLVRPQYLRQKGSFNPEPGTQTIHSRQRDNFHWFFSRKLVDIDPLLVCSLIIPLSGFLPLETCFPASRSPRILKYATTLKSPLERSAFVAIIIYCSFLSSFSVAKLQNRSSSRHG